MKRVLTGVSLKTLNEKTGYSVRHLSRIRNQKRRLSPQTALLISDALDDDQVLQDCCSLCPVGCKLREKKNPASGKSGTTKTA